jgi:hypothetical protein
MFKATTKPSPIFKALYIHIAFTHLLPTGGSARPGGGESGRRPQLCGGVL